MSEGEEKKVIKLSAYKGSAPLGNGEAKSPEGNGSVIVRVNFAQRHLDGARRKADDPLGERNRGLIEEAKANHEKAGRNAIPMHRLSSFIVQNMVRLRNEIEKRIKDKYNVRLITSWEIGSELKRDENPALYELAETLHSTLTEENIDDMTELLQAHMESMFVSPPRRIVVGRNKELGVLSLQF